MKIYVDGNNLTETQKAFNYAQIRTRKEVECAIGWFKERFWVVDGACTKDPVFASKVALLCRGLHNVAERCDAGHLPRLENYLPNPPVVMNHSPAIQV